MKQNRPIFKYLNYKKYILVIPAILIALSMLIYAIWGVNKALEFKDSFAFRINFNAETSSKEFKEYSKIIASEFDNADDTYTITIVKLNEGISSACKVNVYTVNLTDDEATDKITSISKNIEAKLNELDSIGKVSMLKVQKEHALTYGNSLLLVSVALLIFMVLAFIYLWIKFDIKTAFSSLIIAPFSFLCMLSLLTIFRIPFDSSFMLYVLVSTLIGYLCYVIIFNRVKQNIFEKDNNMTNDDLIYNGILTNANALITIVCAFAVSVLLLAFVFNAKVLFICVATTMALIISLYSGIISATALWTMIYNKAQDNKLKARIKLLEAREAKKSNKKSTKETKNEA